MGNQFVVLVGFKSSGKNTAAEALTPYGYQTFSFADALKDSLAAIFCWDRQLLEGTTRESRLWREQPDPWWSEKLAIANFTPRWAMQNFGTEVMRRHFHEEIWVRNVERRIAMTNQPVVLPDARFPNEIDLATQYKGTVIRIKRGPDPNWINYAKLASNGTPAERSQFAEAVNVHESEWRYLASDVHATIENDGSIALLQERILIELGLDHSMSRR